MKRRVADERVKLIAFPGKPEPGLQRGVDLSDNADLQMILDEAECAASDGAGKPTSLNEMIK